MILAGIDEAGLGPLLGPLVVVAAALHTPSDWQPSTPWSRLEDVISRKITRRETKIMVGDSKEVYSRCGFAALEQGFFSFLAAGGHHTFPFDRKTLLQAVGADFCEAECADLPWYSSAAPWSCPGEESRVDDRLWQGLMKGMAAAGCKAAGLWALPVTARRFNRLIDSGLNKSEALMTQTGTHLLTLARSFPEEELLITVDKQGGRDRYHPFLLTLFPDDWIDILEEGRNVSRYRIRREAGEIRVSFEPKADKNAFCVALASMTAKYLRERFMLDLNAYFISRVPWLKPTAGYPGDAPRFLQEINGVIAAEQIDPEILIRKR